MVVVVLCFKFINDLAFETYVWMKLPDDVCKAAWNPAQYCNALSRRIIG